MNSPLDNPLTAGSEGFSLDNLDFDALRDFSTGIDTQETEAGALHSNHRGYIGDDGNIYRKELTYNKQTGEMEREYTDEQLYFWTPPQELGDRGMSADQEEAGAGRDRLGAQGLYTKAEIQEAFEADQGMGYLKQFTTWDKYWNFIEQSTALFADPEYNDLTDGNMTAWDFQDSPEYMALLEETGIPLQYTNDDGDVFNWNGTGYSKDYKVDDSIGIDVINSAFLGVIGSVIAGPLVAGALTGAGMGAAAAKAASSAIMSLAQDAMTTGDLSFGDALLSAGTAYLGESFTGAFEDSLVDAVDKSEQIRDGLLGKFADAGINPNSVKGKELFNKLLKQYELLDTAKGVGGTVSDIVSSVWDAYKESDDYNVDYGGADPDDADIINDGIQNEDDEFEEDFNPADPDIESPKFPPKDDSGGGGGGGDDAAPDTDGDGIPDSEDEFPNDPLNGGNTPPELEDKRWVYKDGVWTDGFETVIGPGTEGAEMSDEEMSEAWETGDYTWGEADGDEVVTPDVPGTPTPDTESETEVVWSAVLGGFVDPSVINPETGKPVDETPNPETPPGETPGSETPGTEGEGDPCSLADGTTGTIQGGVCTATTNGPNGENTGPGEGEACTLSDGTEGVIKDGQCVGKKTGDGPGEGGDDGPGDGGNGIGVSNGLFAGGGNGSTTSWSPLPPPITLKPAYYKTAAAQKNSRAPVLQSLFEDLMA